jgi:hypothetical protein
MPVQYVIDKVRRVVITTAWGQVSFDDFMAHHTLIGDPDFHPELNQLVDGTQVTELAISMDELKRLTCCRISPSSRRAAQPFVFGIAQMAQTYREIAKASSHIRVFRDLPTALKWLRLDESDWHQSYSATQNPCQTS